MHILGALAGEAGSVRGEIVDNGSALVLIIFATGSVLTG